MINTIPTTGIKINVTARLINIFDFINLPANETIANIQRLACVDTQSI